MAKQRLTDRDLEIQNQLEQQIAKMSTHAGRRQVMEQHYNDCAPEAENFCHIPNPADTCQPNQTVWGQNLLRMRSSRQGLYDHMRSLGASPEGAKLNSNLAADCEWLRLQIIKSEQQ